MNDYIVSLIRTFVPIGVGIVIAWLTSVGIDIDGEQAVQFFTGAVIAVYYGVVRWLEAKVPWIGWLLGMPKPPSYTPQ